MNRCIVIVLAALVGVFISSCGGLLLEEPPGTENVEISGIQATGIGTDTATITWSTNVPTTHIVEYGLASGSYSESTLQSQNAETSHTVNLTGLSEGTVYYYRVKNYNLSLADASSGEYTFTTAATPPPTPEQRLRGIWLIGGLAGSTYTSPIQQVDLYDPETDTWYANVTSLPTPVSFAGAASYGGRIFVFGGFDAAGTALLTVQIYAVSTDSWTTGTGVPAVRANIHAATVNDRIYVLGGTTGNATAAFGGAATTYEFTPVGSGSWATKTNFAAARANRLCLAFNDVVYNMGGRSAAATLVTEHDGFSVASNALTTGATEVVLSAARAGMAGAVYAPAVGPGIMVIAGGFSALSINANYPCSTGATGTVSNLFQFLRYPFVAPATWQTVAGTFPSIGFGAASLYGSVFYYFGGTNSVSSAIGFSNVYSFDLDALPAGAWQTAASMPAGRYGHCAVAVRQ